MPRTADEVVTARLWQDPLEAIRVHWHRIVSHVEAHGKLPVDANWPKTINRWAWDARVSGPELRLFVTVSGAPYAEDIENRRRQRYAVVTALAELDYEPVQSDRVGYFVAPALAGSGPAEPCSAESRPNSINSQPKEQETKLSARFAAKCISLVGFERYKPPSTDNSSKWNTVTVLWVDSDYLGKTPLDTLAALDLVLDRVHSVGRSGAHDDGAGNVSVILGPNESSILQKMKTDRAKPPDERPALNFLRCASAYPWRIEDLFDTKAWSDGVRCRAGSAGPESVVCNGNGDRLEGRKTGLVPELVA